MNLKTVCFGFVCLCVLTVSIAAHAETHFVSDKMKITFRSGPGTDRKIITLLDSGQTLEVVQKEAEWSLVQLPNGKEGWVLHRYLTTVVPCDTRIEILENKHQALTVRTEGLSRKNSQLKEDNEKLNEALLSARADLEKSRTAFDSLTKESADYLELKSKHKQTVTHLSDQTKRANDLEKELNRLLNKRNIMWFLSGAGILLMGVVIGLMTRPKKRTSSLL